MWLSSFHSENPHLRIRNPKWYSSKFILVFNVLLMLIVCLKCSWLLQILNLLPCRFLLSTIFSGIHSSEKLAMPKQLVILCLSLFFVVIYLNFHTSMDFWICRDCLTDYIFPYRLLTYIRPWRSSCPWFLFLFLKRKSNPMELIGVLNVQMFLLRQGLEYWLVLYKT